MSTKWHCGALGCAFMFLAAASIPGCDEVNDELNDGVLKNAVVADDDHIDFTPVDDEVTFRSTLDNGIESNGAKLNGAKLNGAKLNGAKLNGITLAGASLLGNAITGLQFQSGSLLKAFDQGSQSYRTGAQLANLILNLDIDTIGNGKKIKINSVVQSGTQPTVYFYDVHNEVSAGNFETICRDGGGTPTTAIPVPKAYDPDTTARLADTNALTWACRGAALAKGIEWGYVPWTSAEMEDAHEAAVRMIRADYCGDGVTHTTNGNAIDVSDKWNIQTPDTTWPIEAKWGPNGAVCLNTPRKLQWARSSIWCAASLPYCTSDGTSTGTPNTSASQYGGLLMTRAVPNNNPSTY